ncbi:MAG TPA: YkgJ family cysteine cluster protein [Polyangiaceae bacterium]|nr:YkgJ family cysteine cluster protein [Polyangiaceae bacterium]
MKRDPRAGDRTHEDALLGELRAIFAEADALHAGRTCATSTECCRFGVTGREPYVTSIEAAAVERAVRARGGALSPKRRALPLSGDAARERVCALLSDRGRCSVYESRPFGCRTFFCERATKAARPTRDAERALVDRLRALAERHAPGGDAPRPLSRLFPTR